MMGRITGQFSPPDSTGACFHDLRLGLRRGKHLVEVPLNPLAERIQNLQSEIDSIEAHMREWKEENLPKKE